MTVCYCLIGTQGNHHLGDLMMSLREPGEETLKPYPRRPVAYIRKFTFSMMAAVSSGVYLTMN